MRVKTEGFSYLRHGARAIGALSLVPLFVACASIFAVQPKVSMLSDGGQYDQALALLENDAQKYGSRNRLIYLLDKGLLQHYAGKYSESIKTFDAAKQYYDELYTASLTKIAASWILNDYALPYRGEDFERVMINIIQALNYVLLGQYDEAIVEARDADSTLTAINAQYPTDQKNVYTEDAFARLLMGILYESGKTSEAMHDARIDYAKAVQIYTDLYLAHYEVPPPPILTDNLRRAEAASERSSNIFAAKSGGTSVPARDYAEIYLIHYNGLCPVKVEEKFSVPLPQGNVISIAFPKYKNRDYTVISATLNAKNDQGKIFSAAGYIAQPLGTIARNDLLRRRMRFIAKSTARAASRYLVESNQEQSIVKHHGNAAAQWFDFAASMFNILIERADVRCWQTLPDQIRLARLMVPPGNYALSVATHTQTGSDTPERIIAQRTLAAGETAFLILHTAQ